MILIIPLSKPAYIVFRCHRYALASPRFQHQINIYLLRTFGTEHFTPECHLFISSKLRPCMIGYFPLFHRSLIEFFGRKFFPANYLSIWQQIFSGQYSHFSFQTGKLYLNVPFIVRWFSWHPVFIQHFIRIIYIHYIRVDFQLPSIIILFVKKINTCSRVTDYRRRADSGNMLQCCRIFGTGGRSIWIIEHISGVQFAQLLIVTHPEITESSVVRIIPEVFATRNTTHHFSGNHTAYRLWRSKDHIEKMSLPT